MPTAISVALWAVERDAALPYEAIAIFAVDYSTRWWATSRSRMRSQPFRSSCDVRRRCHRHLRWRTPSHTAADIVAGDVVLIEEGDTIPADGRLIEFDSAPDRGSCEHPCESVD
jgi:P-type Ca2+ transporter type 2C